MKRDDLQEELRKGIKQADDGEIVDGEKAFKDLIAESLTQAISLRLPTSLLESIIRRMGVGGSRNPSNGQMMGCTTFHPSYALAEFILPSQTMRLHPKS